MKFTFRVTRVVNRTSTGGSGTKKTESIRLDPVVDSGAGAVLECSGGLTLRITDEAQMGRFEHGQQVEIELATEA